MTPTLTCKPTTGRWRSTRAAVASLALLIAALPAPARAARGRGKTRKPVETASPHDVSAIADDLVILTDGKGHHIALVPFGKDDEVFYGDGKSFYLQRVWSSSAVGTEQFSKTFWDPRITAGYKANVSFKDDAYSLRCDDRETAFTPLPEDARAALLKEARFFGTLWKYQAHALARDDRGTYYYVDHLREPPENLTFRIFRGLRGKMQLLQMVNVVSDSAGEIFATRKGELRLILGGANKETLWIEGKRRTPLTGLPVQENAVLIYRDLGAYLGQRLGTPCDDL